MGRKVAWPTPREVEASPFDGLIHALKEVSTERGTRTIEVRCGASMPKYRSFDRLAGATGYDSVLTCPACIELGSPQPQ